MKFAKKYILGGVCFAIINSGTVWAEYAGEDPEIVKLREQIKKLEGQINEMQETDKQFELKAQGLEDKLKEQNDEFQKTRDSLKTEIDEAKKDSETVESLKEKVEQLEGVQASSSEKIEALETSVNSKSSDDEGKIGKDVLELNQAVSKLHEELEAQKELNTQQNLESAKNAAEIDKLKKKENKSSKLSAVGGFLGDLAKGGLGLLASKLSDGNVNSTSEVYGSVFKNGMDLLSQKINPDAIKEKLINGEAIADITKEMNDAEKTEFQAIAQDIQKGKSDEEVQEKLDKLNEKIATRKTDEVISEVEKSKFQKRTFYGLNSAFNSPNLSETVVRIYELSVGASDAPKAENILSGNISSTDQDAVNAIYDMVSKGATLNDIFDCISFHTEGVPMQVERKDVPKDSMVNTLLSMAVTEAEQKNNNEEGQGSQPVSDDNAKTTQGGVVEGNLLPEASDGSVTEMSATQDLVLNDNGELVEDLGETPIPGSGITDDIGINTQNSVLNNNEEVLDDLGHSAIPNAETINNIGDDTGINTQNSVLHKNGKLERSATPDTGTINDIGDDTLYPELDDNIDWMTDMNNSGKLGKSTTPDNETINDVGGDTLYPELDDVDRISAIQNTVRNGVRKIDKSTTLDTGTTRGMEAMIGKDVGKDALKVEAATQTDSQNMVTDSNGTVPKSAMRDPTSM